MTVPPPPVALPPTWMPLRAAAIVPEFVMAPLKVATIRAAIARPAADQHAVLAAMVPELLTLPVKVEIVTEPVLADLPTRMPFWPAVMVPELLMLPEKAAIVTEWLVSAAPPTTMPLPDAAAIVPEFVMPPPKVAMVTLAPKSERPTTMADALGNCPPRSCRHC